MTEFATGRIKNHDPKSREWPALRSLEKHRRVAHRIYGPRLNQKRVGACVLFTAAEAVNSITLHRKGRRLATTDSAFDWYARTTADDPYPGTWTWDGPGTATGRGQDTGTDMNSAAKILRADGEISEWRHCFSFEQFLAELQHGVVAVGMDWDRSMFEVDKDGFVHPDGHNVGGHEILFRADNPDKEWAEFRNHWRNEDGSWWGLNGYGRMTYSDLRAKLDAGGDATILIRAA